MSQQSMLCCHLSSPQLTVQAEHKAAVTRLKDREARKAASAGSKKRKLKQIEYKGGGDSVAAIEPSPSTLELDQPRKR